MSNVSLNSLFQIARSGMLAQQMRVDMVANNVANMNTVGYKRSRAEFQEHLTREAGTLPEAGSRAYGEAAGTALVATQRIFGQGVIEESDRPWDMAINGPGFFQVQLPDGEIGYTRDGTFGLDGEGRLVSSDGYPVIPEIIVPADAQDAMISPDGSVQVSLPGELEPQTIGALTLARFPNAGGLEAIGDNLFRETEASGVAQVGQPGAAGMGDLRGYAREASNVDMSQEVTNLLAAQRAYSLMIRALETSDQMLDLVNQMRAG